MSLATRPLVPAFGEILRDAILEQGFPLQYEDRWECAGVDAFDTKNELKLIPHFHDSQDRLFAKTSAASKAIGARVENWGSCNYYSDRQVQATSDITWRGQVATWVMRVRCVWVLPARPQPHGAFLSEVRLVPRYVSLRSYWDVLQPSFL